MSEIDSLRKANEDFHEAEREWYIKNQELEAENAKLENLCDERQKTIDLQIQRHQEFQLLFEIAQTKAATFRNTLERIVDDVDCTDVDECKFVAAETLTSVWPERRERR